MTSMTSPSEPQSPRRGRKYLREPEPLHYPSEVDIHAEAAVPETLTHLHLRTSLYLSVRLAYPQATVTCDQFMYWDPTNLYDCMAPDLAVRLGGPPDLLEVWRTWQLGAPHVAVEIVSKHDRSRHQVETKLRDYRRAGVGEVVRFDPAGPELRLFDFIEGDLVERELKEPESFRCDALAAYWTIVDDPQLGPALRLSLDPLGKTLLPTPEEAERARAEAERVKAEAERVKAEAERAEKERAFARLRELERALESHGIAVPPPKSG